jgi:hypothetical protein
VQQIRASEQSMQINGIKLQELMKDIQQDKDTQELAKTPEVQQAIKDLSPSKQAAYMAKVMQPINWEGSMKLMEKAEKMGKFEADGTKATAEAEKLTRQNRAAVIAMFNPDSMYLPPAEVLGSLTSKTFTPKELKALEYEWSGWTPEMRKDFMQKTADNQAAADVQRVAASKEKSIGELAVKIENMGLKSEALRLAGDRDAAREQARQATADRAETKEERIKAENQAKHDEKGVNLIVSLSQKARTDEKLQALKKAADDEKDSWNVGGKIAGVFGGDSSPPSKAQTAYQDYYKTNFLNPMKMAAQRMSPEKRREASIVGEVPIAELLALEDDKKPAVVSSNKAEGKIGGVPIEKSFIKATNEKDFNAKWSKLGPNETIIGPDGVLYKKKAQ